MRLAILLLATVLALQVHRTPAESFVGVGIWYAGPGALAPSTAFGDVDAIKAHLALIRRTGFNGITTWVTWREAEPERGVYSLAGVERFVAAAAAADLKATIVGYVEPRPAWAFTDVNAASRFIEYLTRRMSLHPAVIGVIGSSRLDQSSIARIEVSPGGAPAARLAMWAEISRGRRNVAFAASDSPLSPSVLSLGETAGVVSRNQALFAPLNPRTATVATAGAKPEEVQVRMLESADALMIIGLNSTAEKRRVTMVFPPEIPEAIWQNLETGTAVSFVMSKDGPFLDHTFAPHDALVLMIRKAIR